MEANPLAPPLGAAAAGGGAVKITVGSRWQCTGAILRVGTVDAIDSQNGRVLVRYDGGGSSDMTRDWFLRWYLPLPGDQ